MGILSLSLVEEGSKMKFVAAACLVAAAFAEPEAKADADAGLLYGAYGYSSLGYAGYHGLGYAGYAGYPYAYGAYPYAHGAHYIGKRAADAEPEADADAAVLYGAYGYSGLGYAGYHGLGYRGYAGYPYAYGAYPYTYGAHYVGKRSADAEPEANADAAYLYGAYGYAGYHGLGYAGYRHAGYPYAYG